MKKKLVLTVLALLALPGTIRPYRPVMMTLISAENDEIAISTNAARLSGTIKNMLADMPAEGKAQITLPDIKTKTLQAIVNILEPINAQVQKQAIEQLKQLNFIKRPLDDRFIAKNVQPFANKILSPQNIDQIKEVTLAANYLEIPFLINAGAKVYVEKYLQKRPKAEWHNVLGAIKGDFPQDIRLYFKKQFTLAQAGAKEELSIADYIALYGQPQAETITSPWIDITQAFIEIPQISSLDLSKKNITSLYGVEMLSAKNDIEMLSLADNFILDNTTDPDFPDEPFKTYGNLSALDLARNQLETLPKNIFTGLSNLKYLELGGNQITTLPVGIFNGLSNLEQLSLSRNKFKESTEEFRTKYNLSATVQIEGLRD